MDLELRDLRANSEYSVEKITKNLGEKIVRTMPCNMIVADVV